MPVTASYIIAAVMVAPAMIQVGVPDVAAHMFIFYYAVLSEVSPPTALSPFAAAAITGARPFPTMMLTWKYTLPAFVFPFAFTLSAQGLGLLMQGPLGDVVLSTGTAVDRHPGARAGLGGWIRGPANAAGARARHERRPAAVLRRHAVGCGRAGAVRGGCGVPPCPRPDAGDAGRRIDLHSKQRPVSGGDFALCPLPTAYCQLLTALCPGRRLHGGRKSSWRPLDAGSVTGRAHGERRPAGFRAGTAADNVPGAIPWTRPVVKTGPSDLRERGRRSLAPCLAAGDLWQGAT